tara:strand:+ start:47 stop:232 length:186 start_codon:yes stop_codon:yes gene_type:complete
MDVKRASQTHHTPHIGLPQNMPDIRTISVKINPKGADAFAIIEAVGIFLIKNNKFAIAIEV